MEQEAEWGGAHCEGDTQQTEVSSLFCNVYIDLFSFYFKSCGAGCCVPECHERAVLR